MSNLSADLVIQEAHERSIDRRLDRTIGRIRGLALGATAAMAVFGGAVLIGKNSSDGSPAHDGISKIESCTKDELAGSTIDKATALAAINFCATEAQVTLLPGELHAIEVAVAPAIDFAG